MTQVLLNSLVTTAAIMPLAIDVFLVYRLYRFFPFSSAAIFGLAPYLALYFDGVEQPFAASAGALTATIVALGSVGGLFFYEIGQRRQGSPLQLFLLSMGLLVVVQNVVALISGPQPIPLDLLATEPLRLSATMVLGGPRIGMLVWGGATLAVVLAIQRWTVLGLQWRALANDAELAEVVGLRPRRALVTAFCLGAVCTAGAGMLQAADTAMTPYMGLRAFMIAAVVVVVGGEKLSGVLLAAVLVAVAQNLGTVLFGGSWQDTLIVGVLLVFLFWRPRGLAATFERVKTA